MSDPVDTDALRDLVRLLLDGPPADTPAETWAIIHQARRPLFEAAAEVDRLRKDLAFWTERADTWKRLARDERNVTDQLRAVIESAPHSAICDWYEDKPCTCWKADAL